MRTSPRLVAYLLAFTLLPMLAVNAEEIGGTRSYWLAFFGNVTSTGTPSVSLGATSPGQALVQIPGRADLTFSYSAGSTQQTVPPEVVHYGTSETLTAKAVHVTTGPGTSLVANNSGTAGSSAGSYLVIPEESLGTNYFVIAPPSPVVTKVGVIATQGDTVVEITPTSATIGRTSKDRFLVQMSAGEVFFFSGDGLSGTEISSSKPVGVISGSECMKYGSGACEQVVEMLPHAGTFGRTHHVVRDLNSSVTSLNTPTQIVAASDDCQIWINGELVKTLGFGESHFVKLNTEGTVASTISSTKPVLVAQFTNAGSFTSNNYAGDTAMQIVTPTEQYLSSATIVVPSSPSNRMLTIVVRKQDSGQVRVNGVLLDTEPWPLLLSDYVALRVNLPSPSGTYFAVEAPGPLAASYLAVSSSAGASSSASRAYADFSASAPQPTQTQDAPNQPEPNESAPQETGTVEPPASVNKEVAGSSTTSPTPTPETTNSSTPSPSESASAGPSPEPTVEVTSGPTASANANQTTTPTPTSTQTPEATPTSSSASTQPASAPQTVSGGGGGGGGSSDPSPVVAAAPAPVASVVSEPAPVAAKPVSLDSVVPVVRPVVIKPLVIAPMSIGFAAASSKLSAAQLRAIAKKARTLKPGSLVTCIGYSGVGSNARALKALALNRATVVCDAYAKAAKVRTKVVFGGTLRGSSAANRKVIVRFG